MARNKVCKSDPDWLRAIEAMVSQTVLYFGNRGHRREIAIEQASLALGVSRRKIWSYFYQQPAGITREEYERVRERYRLHLNQQTLDLIARAEALQKERHQMDLGL